MLNSLEIERALLGVGLKPDTTTAHILGFRHKGLSHPTYVKRPSGNTKVKYVAKSPLVIHMAYTRGRQRFGKAA